MAEAMPTFRPVAAWDSDFRLETAVDCLPGLNLVSSSLVSAKGWQNFTFFTGMKLSAYLIQDLPAITPTRDELDTRLEEEYLQYNLQGIAADIASAGKMTCRADCAGCAYHACEMHRSDCHVKQHHLDSIATA